MDDLPGSLVPAADMPNAPAPQKQAPVTGTQRSQPDLLERMVPYADPRGIPEAALAMGTGMVGQVAGGLSGLAAAALPGPAGQGADVAQRVSNAITYEPRSKSGQTLMKGVEMLGAPVHKAAEAVGEQGAKVSPLLGTIGKTSVEALPLLLGARAGAAESKPLTPAEKAVAQARDQGFVMTPEEMGAGVVPRTAASLAGEPRLAKLMSKENTATATTKAKAELGIAADAPLDLDTLALIRKQEGARYQAVRNIGQVEMDAKYAADIDALGEKYRSAAKDFPGLAKPEIEQVISALKKEDPAIASAEAQGIKLPPEAKQPASFDANSAVDLMGQLRESADKAFRSGETGLAKVYRGGAQALEAQLERHLAATGDTALLDAFRSARERIAKTYAVEKALVGEQVNMQALGRQVEKRKPLTGGLKEAGDYARDFERSSQKPTHMPTGATAHDIALSALRAIGGTPGLGWDIASIAARPALREILASQPAQWAMDPRTNLTAPALEGAAAVSAQPQPQKGKR